MKIQAMYLPKEQEALIKGFVINKNGNNDLTIAVVDPDMDDKPVESVIRDIQYASLSIINPLNNVRLMNCLEYAKRFVENDEWDAMRKEAIQRFKLDSGIIPNSRHFNA